MEHLGDFLCEWGEVGFRAQLSPYLSLHWASCGISQCSQGCWEMLGEVGSLVLLVASLKYVLETSWAPLAAPRSQQDFPGGCAVFHPPTHLTPCQELTLSQSAPTMHMEPFAAF